jgi:hypothetical protein
MGEVAKRLEKPRPAADKPSQPPSLPFTSWVGEGLGEGMDEGESRIEFSSVVSRVVRG